MRYSAFSEFHEQRVVSPSINENDVEYGHFLLLGIFSNVFPRSLRYLFLVTACFELQASGPQSAHHIVALGILDQNMTKPLDLVRRVILSIANNTDFV